MTNPTTFQGFLFATYSGNTDDITQIADANIHKFSNAYIQYNTWNSTPNQREEIKAYRDDNTRNLTRITASGKKSVFSFKTRNNMHLTDKKALLKFFTDYETSATQRKIKLIYWNDEESTYKQGVFYRPNLQFPIVNITNDDIIYGELEIDFIEY